MKNARIIQSLLLVLFCWTAAQAQQTSSKEGKQFTFTNNTGQATNDLHLTLSKATHPINTVTDPVTGVKKVGGIYENYPSQDVSPHDYKTGGAGVAAGGSVTIQFNENTRINKWYWTFNGKRVGPEMNGNIADLAVISVTPLPDPFRPDRATVSVGIGASLPFQNPEGIYISHTQLHDNFTRSIATQPAVIEQIMERMEGVFAPGVNTHPSQHTLPDATLQASAQIMPGLQLGFSLSRNLEFSLGAHYFSSTFTGRLPITVFPFENPAPRIEYGAINASSNGLLMDFSLRYLLPSKKVRPYLEAGARRLSVLQNETHLEIAGLQLPFDEIKTASGFSAYAGAGVRAYLGANAYLQAGAMLSKWPGSGYAPGGHVSVGWTFGRR